jgi:hypothetical protein
MGSIDAPNEDQTSVEAGTLRALLRSELSACAAYRAVVPAVERGGEFPALSLRGLLKSHRRFAGELREVLRRQSVDPSGIDGVADEWVHAHDGIAGLPERADGPSIFRSLRAGERAALAKARAALEVLDEPSAAFLRHRFVPGLEEHLELLDTLAGFQDWLARPEPQLA